jgi:hypothetical protein
MLLLAVTSGVARSAPEVPLSDAAIDAQCRPYFHDACSEAMGHWLPGGLGSIWGWKGATRVARRDEFQYEHQPQSQAPLDVKGPYDGTFFVFGNAGPPRGHAVYDYSHHIAFYDVGCCSWQAATEIADAPLPPKHLVHRDLLALSTERGVRLRQTEREVMSIYGKATFSAEPRHPDVRVLSYATEFPFETSRCEQTQTFLFREHRLIEIQLTSAC